MQRLIDSNETKNMLSIYNSFLLAVDFTHLPESELEFHTEMFKMICEILNSVRDTYINLHCCQTLSVFCKEFIRLKPDLRPVLKQLFVKLSNPNVGMDDSACLYLGHAIYNMFASEQ